MLKKCAETAIVCYVCRKTEVTVKNKFIFPIVYDFCHKCKELMEYDFARQLKGLKALPLKSLRVERKLLKPKQEDDGA